MAIYRLGFTQIKSIQGNTFIYKILIKNEFEKNYEIEYLSLIRIYGEQDAVLEIHKNQTTLISKDRVFDIHNKEVTWFKKIWSGL